MEVIELIINYRWDTIDKYDLKFNGLKNLKVPRSKKFECAPKFLLFQIIFATFLDPTMQPLEENRSRGQKIPPFWISICTCRNLPASHHHNWRVNAEEREYYKNRPPKMRFTWIGTENELSQMKQVLTFLFNLHLCLYTLTKSLSPIWLYRLWKSQQLIISEAICYKLVNVDDFLHQIN